MKWNHKMHNGTMVLTSVYETFELFPFHWLRKMYSKCVIIIDRLDEKKSK